MPESFLGKDNWAPNGFVDPMDEYAMNQVFANSMLIPGLFYAYNLPFDGRMNADESFGGNSYQYIGTEVQVGSAITMRNAASAAELPVNENDPGSAQLLQSIYERVSAFWQSIRNASGTSSAEWGGE